MTQQSDFTQPRPRQARQTARLRVPPAVASGWVPVAGLALVAIGLVTPWLRVPLEPAKSAFSLPVLITGVPTRGGFSYGAVVTVILLVAAAALVWARARRSAWLAVAGLGAMVAPLYFVFESVIADRALTGHLSEQQAELTSIISQLTYTIPRNQVSSFLFVPITGDWQPVISALRPGWYLTLIGGAFLFARGVPALWAQIAGRRLWASAAGAVVVLALVATLGRGFAASSVLDSATDTLQAGDYQAAISRLNLADALNPVLRSDPEYALDRGQALASGGDQTSGFALMYLASLRSSVHDDFGSLALMEDAASSSPSIDVITNTLLDQARRLAAKRQDPGILEGVLSHAFGNRVAERYMLGRILYTRGDFDASRRELGKAEALNIPDSNVNSSIDTYIGLSDMRLGDLTEARSEVLAAIKLDTQYINSLARTIATGLYVSGNI